MNIRTISIKRMLVAGVTLVAALAVGLTAVGAQDTTPPDRPGRGLGMGMFGDGGRFGGRDGQRGMGLMVEWGQIVADATGLELAEIAQQMRDGSTLATIITDNGGDVEAVIASIVSSATESINTAVTEGTITQERADMILTNLEDHVTAFVNGEGPGIGGRIANTVRAGLRVGLVREVAEATGLEVSAVREPQRVTVFMNKVL